MKESVHQSDSVKYPVRCLVSWSHIELHVVLY